MMEKEIQLISEEGAKTWLIQKTNGSLWQNGRKIFVSSAEASKEGWRVDAVKVVWDPNDEKKK